MNIYFDVDDVDFKLKDKMRLRKWIAEVVRRNGMRLGEISYSFCSDERLYEVNKTFLQHDTYTDIITFDDVEGDLVSGDILISVERVGENAEKYGVAFDEELHRVIIHGVLHLLGQGDKSEPEAREMRRRENESLLLWQELFACR